jgi:ATP-dependent DNA helicase RecG
VSDARNQALIDDLLALQVENAWVELKHNNSDPLMIGQRISAISNSARLSDKHFGYILWGVDDKTKEVVGTSFEPSKSEAKNEPLEFYLAKRLQPSIPIKFIELDRDEMRLVLLEIPAATTAPVEFDREARIRIGSATPRLSDHPERQQELWRKLQPYVWEKGVSALFVDGDTVLSQIDYVSY